MDNDEFSVLTRKLIVFAALTGVAGAAVVFGLWANIAGLIAAGAVVFALAAYLTGMAETTILDRYHKK